MVLMFMTKNIIFPQQENTLERLINLNYNELFPVSENYDKYEVQIIYTQINRDLQNKPVLSTFSFNEKPNKYFYPASTVKFPQAVAALEKLNDLKIVGLNKFTHFSIDSFYEGHVSFPYGYKDDCGFPNIAEYIKRVFLVSDNEAANRLYDFLGQSELNERLRKRAISNTKITHRLSVARTPQQNMETNPFQFYDVNGIVIYTQPAKFDSINYELNLTDTKKGIGYYQNGNLINEPKDFNRSNFFGLRDQHNLMIKIMFPFIFPLEERFNLTNEDYEFLYKYMSLLPKDCECPNYKDENHWDSYVKFFMFGDSKEEMPSHIKIFNKVGSAYGYLTDNAYIIDLENDIEFILSATIHVNENQIYNDDTYEYQEIGYPFFAKLGKIIYEFEKNRTRKVKPDLSRYIKN